MFDVLVYLFENYLEFPAPREPDALVRKLSMAGFEQEEISEALHWLDGLHTAAGLAGTRKVPVSGIRHFAEDELYKLATECRGFLVFLESAGVIDSALRELIIDRAMALEDREVSLPRFKLIVLMVLWNQSHELDSLLVDSLLGDDAPPTMH